MNVSDVKALADRIRAEIGKAVVGQADTVDLMLTALLAGGHVLLEGPPGTAKTFLAQCFARTLGLDFGRIQFTPDLMPGDIIGTNLFNFQTSTFTLTRGPIFCELLLADEINRTPPKTQAALLEAMQERSVTIDGKAHPLGERFMVVATQNPIEQQGTYPLPEAQLDRFLFKQTLNYPSAGGGARASSPRTACAPAAPTPPTSASASRRTAPPIAAAIGGDRRRAAGRRGGRLCRGPGPRHPRDAATWRPAPARAAARCWRPPPAPGRRCRAATM